MAVTLNDNALTLLATAKDHLDLPAANTDYDDRVSRMLNQASSLIESHTKRILVTQEHTEFYDGRRNNRLITNQFPILGGSATGNKPVLYISANRSFTDPVDPDGYFFNDSELIYPNVFPRGRNNIKIVYNAGLGKVDTVAQTNTLPADLELACLDTVLWLYDSRTDRRIGKTSKNKGDESVAYSVGLPQEIVEFLDKGYTREEFPALAPVGIKNG